MFTVIETPVFYRLAQDCWEEEERQAFAAFIAFNSNAGDVIPGSGGLRKIRWGLRGKGKRGGVRVIYFIKSTEEEIWLLLVYRKSRLDNISPKVLKQIRMEMEND